jgi:hypothetical protein
MLLIALFHVQIPIVGPLFWSGLLAGAILDVAEVEVRGEGGVGG